MSRLGRNDPCHCGSGKKYKQCCLGADDAALVASPAYRAGKLMEVDATVGRAIRRFADTRYGPQWAHAAEHEFLAAAHEEHGEDAAQAEDGEHGAHTAREAHAAHEHSADGCEHPEADVSLAPDWSLYHFQAEEGEEGGSVADLFAAERLDTLDGPQRKWFEAQRAAWFSIWEVQSVEEGVGLQLTDRLTGHSCFVHDPGASADLVLHDGMLARVVECDGVSIITSVHPAALTAVALVEIVNEVAEALEAPAGSISGAALKRPEVALGLAHAWDTLVMELMEAPRAEG